MCVGFGCGEVGRTVLELTEFAGFGNGQGHCVSSVGDVGDGRFSMACADL